jgi:primary-amine oxidase
MRRLFTALLLSAAAPLSAHPLDALTAPEIDGAAAILRAAPQWTKAARIASITLLDPTKASVLNGTAEPRRAVARLLVGSTAVEALIDLAARRVTTWTPAPGQQPSFMLAEILGSVDIVKADKGWRAAMGKRGYTDFSGVLCNPLAVGFVADPALRTERLMNVPCFDATGAKNNTFARPIEGLMATVDLTAKKVIRLIDLGMVPVPAEMPQHDYASQTKYRKPMKPVVQANPAGSNIAITGSEVRWDNWRFHVRLDRRVGPTLSLLRYDDRGTERSVAYEIAPSEMFVPYMDKTPTWSFKSYLDAGEYGLGLLASPLSPGRDCPATAIFRDAVVAGDNGKPMTIPRALCIFERNMGDPVWRHTDPFTANEESRPQVDLVVRSIAVIGNYDYILDFVLTQAGEVEVRVGATGIDAVKGVATQSMADATAAADTAPGTLVAPGLVAVNHEHYIGFRLDLDIDGTTNRVAIDHVAPQTITGNPGRTSLWSIDEMIQTQEGPVEGHGHDALIRILSDRPRGKLAQMPSYELMAGHAATSLLDPADPVQARAGFTKYSTWATAYQPDELYAAGAWANQSPAGQGLPAYVADKQSIDGKDLVLWQVVGFRHITRTEDWPIMPTLWHSFRLRPHNFFDRNPAMDVAPDFASKP